MDGVITRYGWVCPKCGKPTTWARAIPRHVTFKDLRHTTATLLLRAGVDPHAGIHRVLEQHQRVVLGARAHRDAEAALHGGRAILAAHQIPGSAAAEQFRSPGAPRGIWLGLRYTWPQH